MPTLTTDRWVALGSAMGGLGRFALSGAAAHWVGDRFPWGTVAINILGSFVIGFFGVLSEPGGRLGVSPDVRVFVMVGLCGGFTTFSSFSFQTLNLMRDGEILRAGLNVVGSVTLCLLAVWLGYLAATGLNAARAG